MDKILHSTSRLLLAGLIIFELLNEFGVLNFTLHFTWFGLSITAIAVWTGLEIISYFLKKLHAEPLAGWAFLLATSSVYIDALGDILNFYGRYGWYDATAHFLGGASAGAIILSILTALNQSKQFNLRNFWLGFFSLMVANFLGVLYELEEYFEDYFTGSRRLGDGPDTANDIFLNTLGAFMIISAILFFKKRKRPFLNSQK